MPAHRASVGSVGLTRTDLIALLALGSIVVVMLTWFGIASKRGQHTRQCASNLKEITLGFHLWLQDTDCLNLPWADQRKPQPLAVRQNSWFQFGCLSNQLKSPVVLADPADRRHGRRAASSWTAVSAGGFFHPSYQNNACSYALFLDVGLYNRKLPALFSPNQSLVLDRHFSDSGKRSDCTYGFRQVPSYQPGTRVSWTKEVHGPGFGNIGLMDGSVDQIGTTHLTNAIPGIWDWRDDSAHYLFPTSSDR